MQNPDQLYARVKVENEPSQRIVPISTNKPDIPQNIQEKWQKIVNLVAEILCVPTGLITRLTTSDLEIFVASQTQGNPYKRYDKDMLGIGMFCETVAGKREAMIVPEINGSDYWRNNPHATLGMHSYMGVPIEWEDGELFGTFCMLDDKSNPFSQQYQELLNQFKEIIETDLSYLLLYEQMQSQLSAKEMQLREAHHRIKNHFNFLISYLKIQSDEYDEGHGLQSVLKELQNRIHTISLIHDELYQSTASMHIPLDQYLKKLCDYTLHNLVGVHFQINYEIEPMCLSPEKSVSCGYIVSELLTNSIKHAFRGIEAPQINISLRQISPQEIEILYQDNGIGLPEHYEVGLSNSTQSFLLKSMIDQMNGNIQAGNKNGAFFRITLRVD